MNVPEMTNTLVLATHGLISENPPPIFIMFACVMSAVVPFTLLTINKEIKRFIDTGLLAKLLLAISFVAWFGTALGLSIRMLDTRSHSVLTTQDVATVASIHNLEGVVLFGFALFFSTLCLICAMTMFLVKAKH